MEERAVLKTPQESQEYLTLVRRFNSVANSLKGHGLRLYTEKDTINWIQPKARTGSKHSNYYAFNRRDYTELNVFLNAISVKEAEMKRQGYDLEGIKSFNRNVWLDFGRESNAIEGIFEDFSFDLLDFRAKIRGQIAVDPSTRNFDRYEYFKKLLAQYEAIKENNDSVIIRGRKDPHEISLELAREFIAYKYAYKCAKKSRAGQIPSATEFTDMIPNINGLLAGSDFTPFRNIQVYIKGSGHGANWTPVSPEDIFDKLNALGEWYADGKQSGGLHPIEKAAIFHAEFIRIHPFMDGNGRTGRIMSNYILMENEYPTISIRYKNTDQYFKALNKAIETHDIEDLVDMFYTEILNSATKIYECLEFIETHQKPKAPEKQELTK